MDVGTTFYTNLGGGKFVEDTLSTDFTRNKEFASGFGTPHTMAQTAVPHTRCPSLT